MLNAHTIKDFGPSDLMSSGIEGRRRVKISSEDVFATAVENGMGYAGTVTFEILSGQEVSVKTIHNANTAIRLVEAKGLTISYVDGDKSGDLMQLGSARSLNSLIDGGYQYSIEVYDGAPTGDRMLTRDDEITQPYFINGGAIIGLKNNGADSTFTVSLALEGVGLPTVPFMLSAGVDLDANTEMSDYDGAN